MIEEDADFAVLDKTVYIATVNEGGKLQLEMRVKNGRGYVSRGPQFRRRSADRLHPGGFGPLARAQGATTRWKPRVSAR